jgi:hypothetical protein
MPASYARLVAWLMGSLGSNRRKDEPHELFTTRMFHSLRFEIMWLKAETAANTKIASPVP